MENLEKNNLQKEDESLHYIDSLSFEDTEKIMFEMKFDGNCLNKDGDFSNEYKRLINHRANLEKKKMENRNNL